MEQEKETTSSINIEKIETLILTLRGRRVIIDADLARLYGVPTKALNQAVRRNRARFPDDFLFRLSRDERNELVTVCDRFRMLKHSTALPNAFTEFGATMAANVLNSDEAVRTSVFIVRAFVKMREALSAGIVNGQKLSEIEQRLDEHDASIRDIVAAIRRLIAAPDKPRRRIGFDTEERGG